jgi:3' terminal RNA ribose 2'-O-methyltransferase Hen1
MTTALHDERIDAVLHALLDAGARTVLDLGCGAGALLRRLLDCPQFGRIVGVDASIAALAEAERELLAARRDRRLTLIHGSFADPDPRLAGFDAAVMLETIEHIDPGRLSAVERAVFTLHRPKTVLIATPNGEYNRLFEQPARRFRHDGHRFEWSRPRFEDWARGVARRGGCGVGFSEVGEVHPFFGAPTQMAGFHRWGD